MAGLLPPCSPVLVGMLQHARALVLPSVAEPFGLVLLEAWAAGTTVLSSRTSGAMGFVKDGENGFLFSLDAPEEFHEKLALLLEEDGLCKDQADEGYALLRESHSIEGNVERLTELYEKLVAEKQ